MQRNMLSILAEDYKDEIYRFCLRLTANRQEAEELFQDTFLRALQLCHKLACCDNQASSEEKEAINRRNKNFLCGIAANLWKNHYKKEKRRKEILPVVSYEEEQQEVGSGYNMEEELVEKEILKRLHFYIDQLPEKLKIVICMFYTANMKTEEIAKVLHIPNGTVNSRLYLARRKLRIELEADGYEV